MESDGRVFEFESHGHSGNGTRGHRFKCRRRRMVAGWQSLSPSISLVAPGGSNHCRQMERSQNQSSHHNRIFCQSRFIPDGKRLYFSRTPLKDDGIAKRDICAVDVSGKKPWRLTDDNFDK